MHSSGVSLGNSVAAHGPDGGQTGCLYPPSPKPVTHCETWFIPGGEGTEQLRRVLPGCAQAAMYILNCNGGERLCPVDQPQRPDVFPSNSLPFLFFFFSAVN